MDLWDSLFDADKKASRPQEKPLPVPESFPAFPYLTPYSIQTDFMQQLFQCIDQRKVGIFESPTGTGKSLSMICGAVSWLTEREKAEQEQIEEDQKEQSNPQGSKNGSKSGSSDDTPDWVQQHRALSDAAIERQEREQRRRELEERVERIRIREKKMRENLARKMKRQAQGLAPSSGFRSGAGQTKKMKGQDSDEDDEDAEFIIDEYHSDEETKRGGRSKGGDSAFGNVSKEVLELLKSFDQKESAHNSRGKFGDGGDEEPDVLKIYYCSRTHSQLSQFVDELRKTSYGEHLHVVALGSRKSLCINEKFRQKSSTKSNRSADPIVNVNKLNDACLDAQKSGTPSDQRCQFLHTPTTPFNGGASGTPVSFLESGESGEKILQFRDHALARVRDIEELAELGSELETCPYYGSRQTVRHCQLVTLPYNLLLHSSTRESLKLVIKDNILLLDEAHNLINSLLQMHSVALTLQQIALTQDQLRVYLERYETRLSTVNEGYIRVLIRILTYLQQFVAKWQAGGLAESSASIAPSSTAGSVPLYQSAKPRPARPSDRVMRVNEFLHDSGVDHINLFKAHAYLETSGVARKLQGFHESLQRKEAKRLAKEQEKNLGSSPRGRVEIHRGRSVAFQKTGPSSAAPTASTTPVLLLVDAFLMSLLNADNDGRIILTLEEEATGQGQAKGEDDSTPSTAETESKIPGARKPVLKFMLLNPANVFKPLVEEARSVILAGGTMEPVSDLLSHLFPYLKEDPAITESSPSPAVLPAQPSTQAINHYPRIHRFSCGHVIPRENLTTIIMEKSPTGTPLELNFANRNLDQVMDSVGQSLVNLLNMIPDGVVVFFVSYSYMAQVLTRWGVKTGSATATTSILERIQAKKRVFVEPREATEADRMLKEYQDCILARPEHAVAGAGEASGPRGAVLFSVVGGKMSEGINFSDRLGRGVVMVGMPFPNKGSAELQERMRYMDQVQEQELLQLQQKRTNSLSTPSTQMTASHTSVPRLTAGSEYYENLCMRAVNQSIGRAIRHQGDYAVIVLMDRRYGTPRIRKKLPGWIGSSIEVCEQFGPVVGKLATFFKTKRSLALK